MVSMAILTEKCKPMVIIITGFLVLTPGQVPVRQQFPKKILPEIMPEQTVTLRFLRALYWADSLRRGVYRMYAAIRRDLVEGNQLQDWTEQIIEGSRISI